MDRDRQGVRQHLLRVLGHHARLAGRGIEPREHAVLERLDIAAVTADRLGDLLVLE